MAYKCRSRMFLNDSRVLVPLGMIRNNKRAAVPNRASVQLIAFESDIGVSCFRCWGMAFVRSSLTLANDAGCLMLMHCISVNKNKVCSHGIHSLGLSNPDDPHGCPPPPPPPPLFPISSLPRPPSPPFPPPPHPHTYSDTLLSVTSLFPIR